MGLNIFEQDDHSGCRTPVGAEVPPRTWSVKSPLGPLLVVGYFYGHRMRLSDGQHGKLRRVVGWLVASGDVVQDDARVSESDLSPRHETIALRVVDLFAGAGGLSQGFRDAGYEVVAGSDHDPDAMATYARNFPSATTIIGDVRAPAIHDQIAALAQDADVIVGGPPCQAFSQVRSHNRLIDDPRNSLYREFVKVVGTSKPRAFLMENVPGLDQMGVKEQVLADLSHGGQYRVRAQLVDAADFGVPQTRKRLLFFGVHRDLDVAPPTLQGSGASVALTLLRDSVARSAGYKLGLRSDVVAEELLDRLRDPSDLGVVSAEQAISDLLLLKAGRRDDAIPCAELPGAQSAYQRRMRSRRKCLDNVSVPRINRDTELRLLGIPAGGNYRDLADELQVRYITGDRWGPDNGTDRLSRQHYYAYRRLHPQLWAWTLNTKADAVYHYSSARSLSVREFARLQSFPDTFVVTTDPRRGPIPGRYPNGAAHSRYRQVGNAVPPLLAAAAARALSAILEPARSAKVAA